MVVLGTTIHEFDGCDESCGGKLVDGRTKSDHDEKSESLRIAIGNDKPVRPCTLSASHRGIAMPLKGKKSAPRRAGARASKADIAAAFQRASAKAAQSPYRVVRRVER